MTTNPKMVYIAGPMRGIKYFNFPAFDNAKKILEASGWLVASPADLDRQAGFDPFDPDLIPRGEDEYDWKDLNRIGFSLADAIRRDANVLAQCDAIYMLKGWENSKGATAEKAIAEWMGIEILFEEDPPGVVFLDKTKAKSETIGSELRQIPYEGLEAIGRIFSEGAQKYGVDNWKKGIGDAEYQGERLNHAIRHLLLWANQDRAEDHLAKVAWFCVTQIWLAAQEGASARPSTDSPQQRRKR